MKLNQILAAREDLRPKVSNTRKRLLLALHAQSDQFTGMTRRYTPDDEDGEQLPGESVLVRSTAEKVVRLVRTMLEDAWGVECTMDAGNQLATADVVVDGTPILEAVPATYLLGLEKRELGELRKFVDALPVLDPAEEWTLDEEAGFYKSAPVETARTAKVQESLILTQPTDKFPATAERITVDKRVGKWTVQKMSAGIPREIKERMVRRLDAVARAVTIARQEANSVEAPKQTVKPLLDYIFEDLGA
jgi:hypothetical protein